MWEGFYFKNMRIINKNLLLSKKLYIKEYLYKY